MQAIKIKHGEKITKPGVYDMPIEWYHDDCCDGPSISSSGLRTIITECPAMYWAYSYLNPDRLEEEEKDHYSLGQAAHMLLLGETGFTQKFAIRPAELPDEKGVMKPWQGNRTVCKTWMAEQKALGRSVLKPEDIEIVRAMADSLTSDPLMQQGILSGEVERSLIWRDKKTGVWVKCRPDALPRAGEFVNDIKTIASSDTWSCDQAIWNHGYHQQQGLINDGLREVCGIDVPYDHHLLTFVGKKLPCLINVRVIESDAIAFGKALNRRALDKFAECLEFSEWPTYEQHGQTARMPDWMRKEARAAIGGKGAKA